MGFGENSICTDLTPSSEGREVFDKPSTLTTLLKRDTVMEKPWNKIIEAKETTSSNRNLRTSKCENNINATDKEKKKYSRLSANHLS